MASSLSSSSFYEPQFEYSAENTTKLYQSIKMNLQDIQKATKVADSNMKVVQKNARVTAMLLNKIGTKKLTDLDQL